MFTGIIEKTGRIKRITRKKRGYELQIETESAWEDLKIGESICVNGACLTLTDFKDNKLTFDVSPETLRKTNLKKISVNEIVNLERALKLGDRLGGHIVLGHVDDTGIIRSLKKEGDFYTLTIEVPHRISKYIAEKGSLAVDGISLTVASKKDNIIEIAIIPHTFNNTNLKTKRIGDFVNIEVDVIARYVESLIYTNRQNVNWNFLKETGFI